MAKPVTTRRAKAIRKGAGALEFTAHPHRGTSKRNQQGRSTAGGKLADQTRPEKLSTKGQSTKARSSPGVRGRETHSLSSAGRKTTARTQGGATKGSGRKHDW